MMRDMSAAMAEASTVVAQGDPNGKRLRAATMSASWVLRITEHGSKQAPVYVIKERVTAVRRTDKGEKEVTVLRDRGLLYGGPLRRCLPVLRKLTSTIVDDAGISLNIPYYLGPSGSSYRGNLPLDKAAGTKLALLFKLLERVRDMDRAELMAWRIARFTAEEALYWLSRATESGATGNRWALAGMRIMLGGQPGDKGIEQMLFQVRSS